MKRRTAQPVDYAALADFRYEIRRFLNFSERAAHAAGIEPQQHQALLAIKGRPSASKPTVGFLASRLQIRHHTAVELSRRLEARKWIARERGKSDRREVLLRLAPRGERLLEHLSRTHHNELRSAVPRLIDALRAAIAPRDSGRRKKRTR
jgi:DNA-binding MarR family transcriptional regulator